MQATCLTSSPPNEKFKVYKPVFTQPLLVILRLCIERCCTISPFLPSSAQLYSSFIKASDLKFSEHNTDGISSGSELKGKAWCSFQIVIRHHLNSETHHLIGTVPYHSGQLIQQRAKQVFLCQTSTLSQP